MVGGNWCIWTTAAPEPLVILQTLDPNIVHPVLLTESQQNCFAVKIGTGVVLTQAVSAGG